jgi:3-hydroxyacyl-CoA dehydrogenase/3-hydroxy-2-methylbutyryl-CoA dehydrogenase
VRVEGSVTIITGGASGLGEGLARSLVADGGRVVLLDLAGSAGAELAGELGEGARFEPVDVTVPEQVEAAVERAGAAFGRIDVAVGCAGISQAVRTLGRDGEPFPLEEFRRTIDINLVGAFDVVRWAARRMAANPPGEDGERGLIVNVGSIAGIEGHAGQAAYAASKGAINALTLPLARDLAAWGIRVVTVAPGMMDTPMTRAASEGYLQRLLELQLFPRRFGTAEDFARIVRAIMESTLLNGEVIRLDAGARLR